MLKSCLQVGNKITIVPKKLQLFQYIYESIIFPFLFYFLGKDHNSGVWGLLFSGIIWTRLGEKRVTYKQLRFVFFFWFLAFRPPQGLLKYIIHILIPNYLEKNNTNSLIPYLFNWSFWMQTLALCNCFTLCKNRFLPNCPW